MRTDPLRVTAGRPARVVSAACAVGAVLALTLSACGNDGSDALTDVANRIVPGETLLSEVIESAGSALDHSGSAESGFVRLWLTDADFPDQVPLGFIPDGGTLNLSTSPESGIVDSVSLMEVVPGSAVVGVAADSVLCQLHEGMAWRDVFQTVDFQATMWSRDMIAWGSPTDDESLSVRFDEQGLSDVIATSGGETTVLTTTGGLWESRASELDCPEP